MSKRGYEVDDWVFLLPLLRISETRERECVCVSEKERERGRGTLVYIGPFFNMNHKVKSRRKPSYVYVYRYT